MRAVLEVSSTDAVEERLHELGLTIPPCPEPAGAYVPFARAGSLVFVSGQTPIVEGKLAVRGKVGAEVSLEDAQAGARLCALRCLAELKAAVGDLSAVEQIVKVTGYVNCVPGFADQPKVINGASEVLLAAFGDQGRHARAALGVNALPGGAAVEVELVALCR